MKIKDIEVLIGDIIAFNGQVFVCLEFDDEMCIVSHRSHSTFRYYQEECPEHNVRQFRAIHPSAANNGLAVRTAMESTAAKLAECEWLKEIKNVEEVTLAEIIERLGYPIKIVE